MPKLSRNPQQAYLQGKIDGYRMGGSETIMIARHLSVIPIYNIVQKYVDDEELQNKMVLEYCQEHNRIYEREFFGDEDKVRTALSGVKRIYKEIGFEVDESELKVER